MELFFIILLFFTDQGATTVLGYHTANGGMTPTASDQQYNPVRDNNNNERCPTQATVRKTICDHSIQNVAIMSINFFFNFF